MDDTISSHFIVSSDVHIPVKKCAIVEFFSFYDFFSRDGTKFTLQKRYDNKKKTNIKYSKVMCADENFYSVSVLNMYTTEVNLG